MDELPSRIREANRVAMRRGAADLHRHLVEENREALRAFKKVLPG
jgi:hypothetical protein